MSKIIILMIMLIGFTENLFPGALDDYNQACQKQDAQGCLNLGLAYAKGIETEKNYELAKDFLGIACDLGNVQACAELKDMDQHHQRVFSEHEQSCIGGDKKGCYQLGIFYRDGLGIRQDAEAAKGYFKMACDLGDTQACSELNDPAIKRPEQSRTQTKAPKERAGYLEQYTNERFGFTLAYPTNQFVIKILSDNGDGITLYSADRSLELRAYGSWYGESIKEIYRDEQGWAKEAGQKVTYKVLKKNWFVLSGIDGKKQTIFYLKTYFRDGKNSSFRLEYPIGDKEKYNALVSAINKNFRAQ